MKIEYNSVLISQNRRFTCNKCESRFIAEGEGVEWFIKNNPKYLPKEVIAYCPICGNECRDKY